METTCSSRADTEYWTANRTRQAFIDFFVKKCGHKFYKIPPGSPLEGMKRATNSQKYVGFDVYHHTMFEMLGNWSFGDYFKEEAIGWAWELLTDVYKLQPDRLYASYFSGDEEMDIWRKYLPDSQILPFDKTDNFWEMGATGPCGPCTEIHYDRIGGRDAASLIWNNVFMQFNRMADKSLRPLPACSVDTGMGFERLTSVLQDKRSNYDTDIFAPIFAKIKELSGKTYHGRVGDGNEGNIDMAYRVVADHIRTLTFAITDGAVPSSNGRGYVLRRVLRRAVRFGFFRLLVPVVVEHFKGFFPELEARQKFVIEIISQEEDQFSRTLAKGLKEFEKQVQKVGKDKNFPGATAFLLYSTYGFPQELTKLMCEEKGLVLDKEEYDAALQAAKQQSRDAGNSMSGSNKIVLEAEQDVYLNNAGVAATNQSDKYVWHQKPEAVVKVRHNQKIIIFRVLFFFCVCVYSRHTRYTKNNLLHAIFTGAPDYKFIDKVSGDQMVGVILDKTSFYATSGGQVCDVGSFLNENDEALFSVGNVQENGSFIVHIGKCASGSTLKVGDIIRCDVDYDKRQLIAANHTMTHVLNYALRKVLGTEVDQAGSLNDTSKLRFDFTCQKALTTKQLQDVEDMVNANIEASLPINTYPVNYKEALKIHGLRAVFSEKMTADPTNAKWAKYSTELCGGTHLTNSSQARSFAIMKAEAISKGVRRIVGTTGEAAFEAHVQLRALQERFNNAFGIRDVKALEDTRKELQKSMLTMRKKDEMRRLKIASEVVVRADIGSNKKVINKLMNELRKSHKTVSVLIVSVISAKKWINEFMAIAGGRGGGSDKSAQVFGCDVSKIQKALLAVEAMC
eukprot:GSMAST32.ASY1.ANO1.2697.1 assembled CDS